MCLIIFAYDHHPRYSLVVAANRDEFYNRPAAPAAYWSDYPKVLAGRDLKEGGTWMGVTTSGRFAGLTNYRDPANFKSDAPSRGKLVQNYLISNLDPESYIKQLDHEGTLHNGFNVLMGTGEELYYYSNREKIVREVEKGVHGLSNSLLDTPWPKVTKGIRTLEDILQHDDIQTDELFAMMADREQPDDSELPQTGVSLEMERMLAPSFVTSSNYGTRVTTIILVDREHHVQFKERTFPSMQPNKWDEVCYDF